MGRQGGGASAICKGIPDLDAAAHGQVDAVACAVKVDRHGHDTACAAGPAARVGAPPPRGRTDIICINCNKKGHTASECRQPRVEIKDRKCFLCGEPGHVAKDCKLKKAPLKAIEDGPARRPAIMMVQLAPERPRPKGGSLGDHIKTAPPARANQNRFQPLTRDKVVFWEDVARASAPQTASRPLLAAADFPPMPPAHPRIPPTTHIFQEGISKEFHEGKDVVVGSGGSSVKAYKISPVVNPSAANSKLEQKRVF